MDLLTPVTVPVESDGEYQVSIFAIKEGMGILGQTGQCNVVVVSAAAVAYASTTVQGDVSTFTQPQSDSFTTLQNGRLLQF